MSTTSSKSSSTDQYTYDYNLVPPLAFASSPIPKGEQPSIFWLFKVVPAALKVAFNQLAWSQFAKTG